MRVVIQTPPAVEPISQDEALEHLREVDTAAAAVMRRALAARAYLEGETGLTLITTTLDVFMHQFPDARGAILPPHPLQSISSIVTIDEDETETTVDPATYYRSGQRLMLRRDAAWPTTTRRQYEGIRVRCVAGYGDTSGDVPADLRAAILAILGTMHANRESVITGTIVSRIEELTQDVVSRYSVHPPFEAY